MELTITQILVRCALIALWSIILTAFFSKGSIAWLVLYLPVAAAIWLYDEIKVHINEWAKS